jgi:enoyl-CoA hydratase
VKRSLVAAGGALRRLPQRFPRELATELILTGELITADRAYELGAISRLTKPGEALAVAIELAETIAENGPLALIASKQILDQQDSWTLEEFWSNQDEITRRCSPRGRPGGRKAFAEKREAVWKGR